jgi:hypothetical protein
LAMRFSKTAQQPGEPGFHILPTSGYPHSQCSVLGQLRRKSSRAAAGEARVRRAPRPVNGNTADSPATL